MKFFVDFGNVRADGLIVGQNFSFQGPNCSRVFVQGEPDIRLWRSAPSPFPLRLFRRLVVYVEGFIAALGLVDANCQKLIQRFLLCFVGDRKTRPH